MHQESCISSGTPPEPVGFSVGFLYLRAARDCLSAGFLGKSRGHFPSQAISSNLVRLSLRLSMAADSVYRDQGVNLKIVGELELGLVAR